MGSASLKASSQEDDETPPHPPGKVSMQRHQLITDAQLAQSFREEEIVATMWRALNGWFGAGTFLENLLFQFNVMSKGYIDIIALGV
jgi:hypothetical protein